jgi:hypothetical protein
MMHGLSDPPVFMMNMPYFFETWCIPPFKKPRNGRLTRDQKTFNYHLSKVLSYFPLNFVTFFLILLFIQVRVRVEHVFAALKGRFQSLRELRHNIQKRKDFQITMHWIQCCIILHNMIIRFEANHSKDSQTWAYQEGIAFIAPEIEEQEGDDVVGDRSYAGTQGQACRARLMDQLFESPYSNAQHREG